MSEEVEGLDTSADAAAGETDPAAVALALKDAIREKANACLDADTAAPPPPKELKMEIHKPKPVHSWREFLTELGIVVLGIVIAIGLEQTVEYIHHRHQLAEMEDSIRAEGAENEAASAADIRAADIAIAGASAVIAKLQKPATAHGPNPVATMPEIILLIPSDSAWSAARDVGLLSLASRELVDNCWKVYFLQQASILQIRKVYTDLDNIQAMVSVHSDAARLSPSERETLLIAYADYRQSLKVLNIDLGLLNRVTGLTVQGRKIDMNSLYKS